MGKLRTRSRKVAICQGLRALELWLGLEPTPSGLNEEEELGKGYSGSGNSKYKGPEAETWPRDGGMVGSEV